MQCDLKQLLSVGKMNLSLIKLVINRKKVKRVLRNYLHLSVASSFLLWAINVFVADRFNATEHSKEY